MRSSSFLSYPSASRTARNAGKAVQGAADFLRTNDKLATLLPVAARMLALQQDCKALLPVVFDACSVLQFENGQLVLSVANAALAAKLKQQLPKLQEGLLKRGWQVNAVRLKLQVRNIVTEKPYAKELSLPKQAVSAFAALRDSLEDSPQNEALKAAVATLLQRHRRER